ncbi:Hypothetical protein CINCED_3A009790 [Cinara cedri]|uniref:Uncharacterized protein n=1 Tax=Cinara cedri TaxID=506608 RepID=A0A5E4MY65_9HEMI|nr:Hypothetical protein CINCED_3A009790 [Cinara cedri]
MAALSETNVTASIDPTDIFAVKVYIITSSWYVNITPDILTRIFSLMDEIQLIILGTPKFKLHIFLETAIFKQDLFALQNLEWCIFKTIARKTAISLPIVLKQFNQVSCYIDEEITKMRSPPSDMNGIQMFINSLQDDNIIASLPKYEKR